MQIGLGISTSVKHRQIDLPINYSLLDRFTTNHTAPLASPRTCEPGPGQLVITDVANTTSISGSQINITGDNVWGDEAIYGNADFTRKSGLAFGVDMLNEGATHIIGWSNGTGGFGAFGGVNSQGWRIFPNYLAPRGTSDPASPNVLDTVNGVTYKLLTILRSTGVFLVEQSSNKLLWVGNIGNSGIVRPVITALTLASDQKYSNFRVFQLGWPWNTDYGIAVARLINPSIGDQTVIPSSTILDITFTHGATDTSVQFRYTDSNNTYEYVGRASDGMTYILKRSGVTVTTKVQSAPGFLTQGQTYRAVITLDGSGGGGSLYVNDTKISGYSDSEFANVPTLRVNKIAVGISNLVVWPRQVTLPEV